MMIDKTQMDVISKVAGRKNGIALLAMMALVLLRELPMETLRLLAYLITGLAALCIFTQFILEMTERLWLGKDLPENGNGNGTEEPTVPVEPVKPADVLS